MATANPPTTRWRKKQDATSPRRRRSNDAVASVVALASLVLHLVVELPCANVAALLLPRKGAVRKAPPRVQESPLTRGESAEIV